MRMILFTLYKAIDIYIYILMAKIILSWAPMIGFNINYYQQPFKLINDLTEPAFRPFRGILTFGMMDFSPILLFVILQLFQMVLANMINGMPL